MRASKGSDYKLATYRGAESHTSVAGPAGTLFTDEEIKLGSTRGPRSLDFRKRWMWIYVDLGTLGSLPRAAPNRRLTPHR